VVQHHPTGSETTPPYAPRSSRFGSELPSVEDDVNIWRYAILQLHAKNNDNDYTITTSVMTAASTATLHVKYTVLYHIISYDNSKKTHTKEQTERQTYRP